LRPAIAGLTRLVLANTLVISLAILAFTATDRFILALPCVFLAGTAMTITGIGAQTLLQAAGIAETLEADPAAAAPRQLR
jgi:hypothetical protein